MGSTEAAILDSSMYKATIKFFSPFGTRPNHSMGSAHSNDNDFGKLPILLSTIASKHTVVHELGHVLINVNFRSAFGYFQSKLGRQEAAKRISDIALLRTILIEAHNEHMTAALLDGEPTVISPAKRRAMDIVDPADNSHAYESYREAYAVLVGGKDNAVTKQDIKQLNSSMFYGSFKRYVGRLGKKWDGRDIAVEVLDVITSHMDARRAAGESKPYQRLLAQEIINHFKPHQTADKAQDLALARA